MRCRSTCVVLLATVVATGCVPTDFLDRRDEASTVTIEPALLDGTGTGAFSNKRFGAVVAGYGGMIGGQFVSRVAASAGPNTPFAAYPLITDDEISLGSPSMDGCDGDNPCGVGAGTSLVGMGVFRGRSMCLAAAATEEGEIRVQCEDDVTMLIALPRGPSGERFGTAGAGLRTPHPFGGALFGAPGAGGGVGALYRLSDTGAPSPLDVSMGVGLGGGLGEAVAIGVVDADTVLIAGGAPNGADKRVILATVDIDAGGAATTSVRGCIDSTGLGFGEAVAIGDFDGDGMQDVAIGSGTGQADDDSARDNIIHILSGAAMPAPGSCVGAWPEATTLGCPTADGVRCDEAANFGASLAVGDINADGIDDLIVGAPDADVDDVEAAGAVFVFLGTSVLSNLDDTVAALVNSTPSASANLGFAVAASPGQGNMMGIRRDEVIAGAPGADRVYVFLCTGIGGDTASELPGTRCQPLDN